MSSMRARSLAAWPSHLAVVIVAGEEEEDDEDESDPALRFRPPPVVRRRLPPPRELIPFLLLVRVAWVLVLASVPLCDGGCNFING